MFADPGGIKVNGATLSLVESTVQGNTADFATGGILFTGNTLSAVDTVIRDNTGAGGIVGGGMICNLGTATFERVAFVGNSGPHGGALLLEGTACDATLTNVTLSGNSSSSDGALDHHRGTVTLVHLTVSENLPRGLSGAMTVANTIVHGNGGIQCSGSFTSLGHNVDEDDSCGFDQATGIRRWPRPIPRPCSASSTRQAAAPCIRCSPAAKRSTRFLWRTASTPRTCRF
jgi:hypothetical protein